MSNDSIKSYFCVFNNPLLHGYSGSPLEICESLRDDWIAGHEDRTGAWAYCISAAGLHHVHMVLESPNTMRFTQLKSEYAPGMHIEATKGTKAQAEAYINKEPPYAEKGEEVVCVVRHGEIQGRQGHRSDLDEIENLLDLGLTPTKICNKNFRFRRYEKMIVAEYLARRIAETPVKRDVAVHLLVGESGSGKSYEYVKLCEQHGDDKIYIVTDYSSGGFDRYLAEHILFLDEFKGQMAFSTLLSVLDQYRVQVHARYSNVFALWREVYITTVYPPEKLYELMVPPQLREIDSMTQLMRRLADITYCYKTPLGEYRQYTIPAQDYTGYDDLVKRAHAEDEKDIEQLSLGGSSC